MHGRVSTVAVAAVWAPSCAAMAADGEVVCCSCPGVKGAYVSVCCQGCVLQGLRAQLLLVVGLVAVLQLLSLPCKLPELQVVHLSPKVICLHLQQDPCRAVQQGRWVLSVEL